MPSPTSAHSSEGEAAGHGRLALHSSGERRDGFTHISQARRTFSSVLNFCRSAIAALVRSSRRYCPFRSPGGPPLPLAPPCNRQRFFLSRGQYGEIGEIAPTSGT